MRTSLSPAVPLLLAEDLLDRDGCQKLPEINPVMKLLETTLAYALAKHTERTESGVLGVLDGLMRRGAEPPPGQCTSRSK